MVLEICGLDTAEGALVEAMKAFDTDRYVKERAKALDCCGNDDWRGRLCPYHEGFLDGMNDMADQVKRFVDGGDQAD